MRYSHTFLSDDNFDEEVEKLADLVGISYTDYSCFAEKLDDTFRNQENGLGFEEWIRSCTYPSMTDDGEAIAYQKGN